MTLECYHSHGARALLAVVRPCALFFDQRPYRFFNLCHAKSCQGNNTLRIFVRVALGCQGPVGDDLHGNGELMASF